MPEFFPNSRPAEQGFALEPPRIPSDPIDPPVEVEEGGVPLQPERLESPAPVDTDIAAQLAEIKNQFGTLLASQGERSATYERTLNELKFQLELAQNQARPSVQAPPLPPGVDGDAPVLAGGLNRLLHEQVIPTLLAAAEAQAVRAVWNVTPAEEAEVLAAFPNLPQTEPARTRAIRRAVELRRPAPVAASPTPPAPAPALQPRPTRPAAPAVAHVERPTSSPVVAERAPGNNGAMEAAVRKYNEAKAMKNPAERIEAMRAAAMDLAKLGGMDDESFKNTGFRQTG